MPNILIIDDQPGSYLALAEKLVAQRIFSKPFELSYLLQGVEELVGKGTKK